LKSEAAVATGPEPREIADLFAQQVLPYIFEGHQPAASPRLVLLGGQPGAGKSHAIARILHADPDADLVYVTGDSLRPWHPDYTALLRSDLLAIPNHTGPVVATWVRSCIDHAIAERYSLILEGTFRDPDVVAATVRRFASAGYHTEAVVLAVRPERSRLDCVLRSLGTSPALPGRWTPPTAHDTSFARLPHTVAALEAMPELYRISVHTRTGTAFTDEREPDGRWQQPIRASDVLRIEHQRPLNPDAATAWLHQYRVAVEALGRLPTIDVRALPMYLTLIEDADRLAAMATQDPQDPRGRQHADTQRQAAAILQRHHPSSVLMTDRHPHAGRAFPPMAGIVRDVRLEQSAGSRATYDDVAKHRRRDC
jgi:hypothetical protein